MVLQRDTRRGAKCNLENELSVEKVNKNATNMRTIFKEISTDVYNEWLGVFPLPVHYRRQCTNGAEAMKNIAQAEEESM